MGLDKENFFVCADITAMLHGKSLNTELTTNKKTLENPSNQNELTFTTISDI